MALKYSVSALWHIGKLSGKQRISCQVYGKLQKLDICRPFRGLRAGIHKQRKLSVVVGNRFCTGICGGSGSDSNNLIDVAANGISWGRL